MKTFRNAVFNGIPTLERNLKEDKIKKYTPIGEEEIDEENIAIINNIERDYKKFKAKVIGVLSGKICFGNDSVVDVDDYIYISNDCKPEKYDSNLMVYTRCYNKTWDFHEDGSIEITENNGIIERVFD